MIGAIHAISKTAFGVLCAIWVGAGLILNLAPLDAIHGAATTPLPFSTPLDARGYASPGGVIARAESPVALTLTTLNGRPAYLADTVAGRVAFDAKTGFVKPRLTADDAKRIAKRVYLGEGEIADVEATEEATGPAWRVSFDDRYKGTVVVSQLSGEVIRRDVGVSAVYRHIRALHPSSTGSPAPVSKGLALATLIAGGLFAGASIVQRKRRVS